MISFEEVGKMLDEIASELPEDIFKGLNGGINLSPMLKLHPEGKANDLYIMGEYRHEMSFGRYIVIFYGSFVKVYGYLPRDEQKKKLENILFHELTHHVESMAGDHSLEIKDEQDLYRYKSKYGEK